MRFIKSFAWLVVAMAWATGTLTAGSYNWTGAVSTDWSNPGNWSPNGNPGAADTVNFSTGTINFTAPTSFGGQFNWSGGALTGNPLTLAAGAAMNVTGFVGLNNVLTNAGTVTVSGSGRVQVVNNSANFRGGIFNLASGIWDFQNNQDILCGCYGAEFFNNSGLLRKSQGTGQSWVSVAFTNSGTVTALTGGLAFQAGGLINGNYNAASNALVLFASGSFRYTQPPTLTGPGSLQFAGGTLTLVDDILPNLSHTGGTLSLAPGFQGGTITNLALNGSALSGTNFVSGVLTLASGTLNGPLQVQAGGVFNWGNGLASASVTVATNGAINVIGGALASAPVTNNGTVTVTGAGTFGLQNNNGNLLGAVINQPNGIWDFQNNQNVNCGCYGHEFFNNAGLLRKSAGTGQTAINVGFTNSGVVTVLVGGISFSGGGLVNGVFNAAAGGNISFTGGSFAYTQLPVLNGPGVVQSTGGSFTLQADIVPNLLLNGGTVVLAPIFQGGAITNLSLLAGTLAGTNVVAGTFNWQGGLLPGSLTVQSGAVLNWSGGTAGGGLGVASGAVVTISGSVIVQNPLTNQGTVFVSGAGSVGVNNNAGGFIGAIVNAAGGVWDFQNNQNINCGCYGHEYFINAGLLRKSQGTGQTWINVACTNSGTVTVLQGTINFLGGGQLGGTYNAGAGTSILFGGGAFSYAAIPVLNGPGALQFTGGTLTLQSDFIPNLQYAGGTLVLSPAFQGGSITNLTLAGGTLAGSNTVTGVLTMSGGTINGPLFVASGGSLNCNGGTFNAPVTVATNGAVNITGAMSIYNAFNNNGTVTMSGGGSVTVNNNAAGFLGAINNLPSGLWDLQNNQNISCACYGHEFFINSGVLRKSAGSGSSGVNVAFTNAGTVLTLSGTLNFGAGGLVAGIYNTGPGATMALGSGNFLMMNPPVVTGAGLTELSSGNLLMQQDVAPNLLLAGGSVSLAPGFQNAGMITNLTLSGATLAGTNRLTGTMIWAGGQIGGPLTVASNAVLNLTAAGSVTLSDVLTNQGQVLWSGSASLSVANNLGVYRGAIYNQPGAVWDMQGNVTLGCPCYNNEFFINAGLVQKSSGVGTASIGIAFTNSGSVSCLAGTLSFNNGGSVGGGYTTVSGSAINCAGGNFTMGPVPVISGPGSTAFTGGKIALNQGVPANFPLMGGIVTLGAAFQNAGAITNLTLSGSTLAGTNLVTGVMNWAAGAVGGPLTIAGGGTLNLLQSGSVGLNDVLTNGGTVNWSGAGGLVLNNNNSAGLRGGIVNLAGGLWDMQGNQTLGCACYGFEYFNNAGQLRKSAGSGTATLALQFNNTGSVNAQVGTFSFSGGGLVAGNYSAAAGAFINLAGNGFTMGQPAVFTGAGSSQLISGSLTLTQDVPANFALTGGVVLLSPTFQNGSITNFTLSGATLNSTNTVTGVFTWNGGALIGPLTIATNGLLQIVGSTQATLSAPLTNAGTVTVTGPGNLLLNNNNASLRGAIYNLLGANWQIQTNQLISCACFGFELFNNAGTIQKFPGTGTATIGVPVINSGTIDAETGTLAFTGNPAYAQTGATMTFGVGPTNTASGSVSINGNVNLDGTLGINLLNGYTPALSNSFTLVNYGTHAGVFNNLNLPPAGTGRGWQLTYGSGTIGLQVVTNPVAATMISGVVTDNLAQGITNLVVFVFTTNTTSIFLTAVTDANGHYAISVPNGNYTVGVQGLPARGYNSVTNQFATVAGASQVVNFSTSPFSGQSFTISTSVNPLGTGSAVGGGVFAAGSTVTLTATPNTNSLPYIFSSWTENGVFASPSPVYAFPAVRNRQLLANFVLPSFLITATNNPASAGAITGAGSYFYLATNTLTAFPNFGYKFGNWTEAGVLVGTNPVLITQVLTNHNFTANYLEANTTHVVTTVTQPPGLATVTGSGTYTNGQTANFSTPASVTNAPFIYTFQQFTLGGSVVSSGAGFAKKFSTLDPTNLQYVAVYQATSILPQVANVNANYSSPVPATTNFLLTVRFDRAMQTSATPVLFLTNAATVTGLTFPTNGGFWTTYSQANDTYVTPPVTIAPALNGTNQLFVAGALAIGGGVLGTTNPVSYVVDATPPPAPILSLSSSNANSATVAWNAYAAPGDLASFRVFVQTTNFASLVGLPIFNGLGAASRAANFYGLTLDTTYFVAVQAVDTAGNTSPFTTPLPVILPSTVPPAVSVQQSPVGATTAGLAWNAYNTSALFGFAGFRVYHATTNFTSVTGLTPDATLGTAARTYQATGLDRSQTYYFAVVGFNGTNGFNPNVTTVSWSDPYAGTLGANTTIGGNTPSVVNIYQNIQVVSNATLTVSPGTTLLFAPGTGITVVQGALVAAGTALNPILFDSVNDFPGGSPLPGDWQGLNLGPGAGASVLNFVEIRYGAGLTLDGCSPTVGAFTADLNTPAGLSLVNGATLTTVDALLTGNSVGALQTDNALLTMHNSVIQNNDTNAWGAGAFNMFASGNWWGSPSAADVAVSVQGKVAYQTILNYEPVLTPAIGASNGVTQIGTSSANLRLACRTADSFRISEDNTFSGVFFTPFTNAVTFPFSPGGGFKHLYAQFRSATGQTNPPLELDLNYLTGGPIIQSFSLGQNQTLHRPLTVTGSATAVLGMQDIEFYVDGVLQGTNAGGSFSQYFDVRNFGNAIHQVQLLARDTMGNFATLTENVILAVTPPLAPTLATPPYDYITNNATLTILGTAEPNLNIQITDNGQILALLTADAAGKFGVTNATLMEGANTLVAVASDSTGTTPSAARHVTAETVYPAALVLKTPVYYPASGLNVSWQFAPAGKQAINFKLFWATNTFATTNQATGHSTLLGSMNYNVQALADGTYYFGVVGYDSAGNPSPLSALVASVYDATAPALAISYGHPSPVGVGPLSVILSSSKALVATPNLTLQPTGAGSPLLLNLTNVAQNTWQTVFNVTASTPSGTVNVQASAQDLVGNPFSGAPTGLPLVVDTTPPTASLLTVPLGPVPTAVPTNVSISLTLSKSVGPGTSPTLSFTPPAGTNIPIQLAGAGSNWNASLPLTATMSNGFGLFSFTAQDAVGNVGTNFTAGRQLELYNTALPAAPAAPLNLAAASLPGGGVGLTWTAVSNAQIYRLYRQAGTNLTLPAVVYLDNITSNHVTDLPPADGSYAYGLSASRFGSDSAVSKIVGLSDRVPPPAPTNVAVALAPSGVQITWQQPAGEVPASYRIYRNGVLIQTTGTIAPVSDYPPKGTNNYVVSAADSIGNENASAPAAITLLVSPVSHLLVQVNYGQAPSISWVSPDPTAVGFNLYRNGVRQNAALIPGTNYTDQLPLSDLTQYAVTAVNAALQESPPRQVNAYPVAFSLQANPANGQANNPLYVNYFDKFVLGLTNRASGSPLPVAQIQFNRTIVGLDPLGLTQTVNSAVAPGSNFQSVVVFPEASAPAAESLLVTVSQQTDSGGSEVLYLDNFNLPAAQLPATEIAVSVNQLPLAGGLTPFQVQVYNRGFTEMQFIVARGGGGLPGDLYVSVENSLGQELSRTPFLGIPPGTTFLADGRAFVKIAAGASLSFTVPNVLSPAALAGATNVIYAVGISNIYYNFNHADQVISGPLAGSMVSSSLALAPYYALAQTDKTNYANNEAVVITGQALDTVTGLPVPNKPVNIGFATRGFKWYHPVTTDGAGNFQYTYMPAAGFGGTLAIWGAHPLVVDRLNQNQIVVYRLYANPSGGDIQMSKNDTFKFSIGLINPGDTPLTGFVTTFNAYQFSGTNQTPVASVTGTNLTGPGFTVGPGQTQTVNLELSAALNAPNSLGVDFTFTSLEGAAATFHGNLTLLPALPVLAVVNPPSGYLQVNVNRGNQKSGQVTIANNGLRDLQGVTLQQPTNENWIRVNLPTSADGKIHLPDLAVGQSNTFTVVFSPPTNTALGFAPDGIVIQGTNAAAPFTIGVYGLVTSDLTGGMQFFVDDTLGAPVPNAGVRLHNNALQLDLPPFYTDTNGLVTITNMQEGSWNWQASAPGCSPTVGQLDIVADQTGYLHTRLSRSLVTVSFSVVPVPFTDTYDIQVEQTFQTHVPAGVLVVTPPFLSFSNLVDGFEADFTATVENYGLIQMTDCVLHSAQSGGLQLTPLITYIPVLLPMQSVEVPYVLTYTTSGNGPMSVQGGIERRQVGVGDCIANGVPTGGLGADQEAGLAGIINAAMKCYSDDHIQNGVAAIGILAGLSIIASTLTGPLEFFANALGAVLGCLVGLFISDLGGALPADTPVEATLNVAKGDGCFTAETPVLMADGTSRPIAAIHTNDLVRTGTEYGNVATVREIVSLAVTNLYDLRFGPAGEKLLVTGEHQLWVDGKGWTPVFSLHPGDWLFDFAGHRVQVNTRELLNQPAQVYTLGLTGDNAFYANGILVHEGCGLSPGLARVGRKGGAR